MQRKQINSSRSPLKELLVPPLLITTALLFFWGLSSPAQSKSGIPSKEEARDLLRRGAEETDLQSAGASPFHLLVKARSFGEKGEMVEGSYEIWWESNKHWRKRVRWANDTEEDFVDKDRIWKLGDDTHLAESELLKQILDFSSRIKASTKGTVRKVKAGELDGRPVACAELILSDGSSAVAGGDFPEERTICIESTGLPMKVESYGITSLELMEYMHFGEKRFPKTLRATRNRKTLMEADVESLDAFDPAKMDNFAVPAGVPSKPWCSDMIRPAPIRLGNSPPSPYHALGVPNITVMQMDPTSIGKYSIIIFRVGEKGDVLDIRAFMPDGEVPMKDGERKALLKSQFRAATCDGRPIEAEFPIKIHVPQF